MQTKQEHYDSMIQAVERYSPSTDLALVKRAYEYADEKHKGQLRKSGEPYIIHPLAVAEIVAEIGMDTDAIVAALLHDCIEDTDASFEEISRLFGETVANLVEGVTKLTRVQYSTMEEQQMENLRKMFMAMSKDIRVVLIKIADRLHNVRTLEFQTPAKQISKSMETMEIYAPLAHRLGMQKLKWELEDVSLRYLDILCVRLVFCLYAEDAGIFGKHDMFHDYLAQFPTEQKARWSADLNWSYSSNGINVRATGYLLSKRGQVKPGAELGFRVPVFIIPNVSLQGVALVGPVQRFSGGFSWNKGAASVSADALYFLKAASLNFQGGYSWKLPRGVL